MDGSKKKKGTLLHIVEFKISITGFN